jgi:hypothetical protein
MSKSTKSLGLLPGPVGGEKALHDLAIDCDAAAVKRQQARERKAAKKGRPKGAANVQVDLADGQLTSCGKCGSTQREKYFNRRDLDVAGVNVLTGQVYTQIVIRRTRCTSCGQTRDDRHFVNLPTPRGKK